VKKGLMALAIAGLAATACAVLITILANRDKAAVQSEDVATLEPDRGARHANGPRTPASPPDEPPTSGPHRPEPIEKDRTELSDDQILEALHLGNIVIAYEDDPPTDLQADPFSPDLAAAGQAVILDRRPGIGATTALAWRRRTTERLPEFIDAYLGQAPR
jgi:hypothetical protein